MPRRGDRNKSLLALFAAAGQLKSERRRGWVIKLGMKDPESVADHSYRTAVIAMAYSDLRGLDTTRVLKMALIHDLAEAIVGDITPGEVSKRQKRLRESAAMSKILAGLPSSLRTEYSGIWREYTLGETEEARLVKQADKLEMGIQASEYRKADPRNLVQDFIDGARAGISDPDLLAVLGMI